MSSPQDAGLADSPELDPDATPPEGIAVREHSHSWSVRPRHAGPPAGGGFHVGDSARVPSNWWASTDDVPSGSGDAWEMGEPGRGVPPWLIGVAAFVLLAVVGVLGFIKPGYFTTAVLQQSAVRDGVRSVLRNDYRLTNVSDVQCPKNEKVQPGGEFVCTAWVNNALVRIRVVVTDQVGHYQVGRPA